MTVKRQTQCVMPYAMSLVLIMTSPCPNHVANNSFRIQIRDTLIVIVVIVVVTAFIFIFAVNVTMLVLWGLYMAKLTPVPSRRYN